ncbi:hypothetical protein ACFJGW_05945 [Burkholderiaceae bacterium UC74_6]
MRIDWFFPQRLADRLSRNEVSNREVGHLMLANQLFGLVLFYGAFTWANPPWTLLSLLEAVAVAAVTLIGFTRCYFAAGGDDNPRFAQQFNCLMFGSWLWSTAIVWSVFWAGVWLFRTQLFAAVRFDQMGLAQNLAAIGGSFGWLWTVLAAVLWEAIFFARLEKALRRARNPV